MWAEMDGFDPEGFAAGDPLRKDIFYMNPFITCSWYIITASCIIP